MLRTSSADYYAVRPRPGSPLAGAAALACLGLAGLVAITALTARPATSQAYVVEAPVSVAAARAMPSVVQHATLPAAASIAVAGAEGQEVIVPVTSSDGQGWSVMSLAVAPVAALLAIVLWRRSAAAEEVALLPYTGHRSPLLPPQRTSRTALYGKNKNDNFIDQTFTVIADQLLKFLPTTKREKKAFMYYRDGMSAQGTGDYAEALQNYYEALKLETDPFDRSYILYNIGLIHASNGELEKALEYYYQALERNPNLPSALNNIAVIYHFQAETAEQEGRAEEAFELYDKAADYWREAIRLAPTNYMEAQNWLQGRGQLSADRPY